MRITKFSLVPAALILVGITVAGGVIFKLQSQDITDEQPQTSNVLQPTVTAPQAYIGFPVRLLIPKINVSASIESLGLTVNGDLDAPKNVINAGWYNAGPRAGSPGTAVMDGHFGAANGKAAVFDSLHTLQKGDLVYVADSNNVTHTFIVRETRLFQPDEDASVVFSSDGNKAHLNLITCQGKWDNRKESYSTRLVVFTDLLNK